MAFFSIFSSKSRVWTLGLLLFFNLFLLPYGWHVVFGFCPDYYHLCPQFSGLLFWLPYILLCILKYYGFCWCFSLIFSSKNYTNHHVCSFPSHISFFSVTSFFCIISPVVGYYAESNSFLYLETKSVDELDYMFNRDMGNPLFCAVMSPVLW